MANLLEATTHYCKNGHDVRDKDASVHIRNNGTTVCKTCRSNTARKSHLRRQRAIAKAQNKANKPVQPTKVVSPNHPVHAPVQPKLSDVVVEIVNILRDNPDLEVTTLVNLSKAVRNKK